jgi:hypothetical protein
MVWFYGSSVIENAMVMVSVWFIELDHKRLGEACA